MAPVTTIFHKICWDSLKFSKFSKFSNFQTTVFKKSPLTPPPKLNAGVWQKSTSMVNCRRISIEFGGGGGQSHNFCGRLYICRREYKWRHSVVSVGDMNKIRGLKMLSVKFSFFQGFFSAKMHYYMAIWTSRSKAIFLEKPLGLNRLTRNPKLFFTAENCSKHQIWGKIGFWTFRLKRKSNLNPLPPPPKINSQGGESNIRSCFT